MFTGIVSELGTVAEVAPKADAVTFRIVAPHTAGTLGIGDSVAINGVCLTAIDVDGASFIVHAVHETITRTSLGTLEKGDHVNLERPMAADGRFDGHIVQGHVDAVGVITSLANEGTSTRVRIDVSSEVARYVVEKGSVCVDGTSLTVTAVESVSGSAVPSTRSVSWFEIVLIPHTMEVTAFGERRTDDLVNVEVDVIAKYVERMMEPRE
jgi:riboflavin synthase